MTYQARLAAAMKHAKVHPRQLADHLGVSLQAVRKVLDGKSAAFNVFNHFEACKFLGVDAEWLATGEGRMLRTNERNEEGRQRFGNQVSCPTH